MGKIGKKLEKVLTLYSKILMQVKCYLLLKI